MMESPTTQEGKSRKKYGFCNRNSSKNKDSKNPYSTRGREKFSALLSELEEKKKKILSKMGSENVSYVRFVYKDTDECVPVVVKVKKDDKKEEKKNKCYYDHHYYIKEKTIKHVHDSEIMGNFLIECSEADFQKKEDRIQRSESDKKIAIKKKKFSWNDNIWRHPSYYFPVVVILILLLLAFFGRSFVIICICMGWYIIPTIKGSPGSSNVRRSVKKKDYLGTCSDKNIVSDGLSSPKITKSLNNSGNLKDQSPQKHGHRQSW